MSTQRQPRLASATAARLSCSSIQYPQIPLLAGRAIPPLDQVTGSPGGHVAYEPQARHITGTFARVESGTPLQRINATFLRLN